MKVITVKHRTTYNR